MTQEDKELLLSLLLKANEEGILHIYDKSEDLYEIGWMFMDSYINIKIKTF